MQERVVREIRTLRAMWRALETGSRQVLNGHEGGNPGHKPRMSLRATAPVLDPTRKQNIPAYKSSARRRKNSSEWKALGGSTEQHSALAAPAWASCIASYAAS